MRIVMSVAAGAAAGFLLGYAGRCASGQCPLTSNPWVSTAVGALCGLALALGT